MPSSWPASLSVEKGVLRGRSGRWSRCLEINDRRDRAVGRGGARVMTERGLRGLRGRVRGVKTRGRARVAGGFLGQVLREEDPTV